jgi:AraC-like DNA-binding protein
VIADLPGDGPFEAIQAAPWPERYRQHAAAVAWLRKSGAPGGHTALPLDLYVLTVYCDPALHCAPVGEDVRLEVMVSALRTKATPFRSSGGGELAVALLTPLGLLQALRAPLENLADQRLPLAWFFGWTEQRNLRDALLHAPAPEARLQVLSAWLERRIADAPPLAGPALRVAEAAAALQVHAAEPLPVERVIAASRIGRRQLERDFTRWLGVSPGAYARLVRFQRAAGAIIAGDTLPGAAAEHGYADQPHMTRVFNDLAQTTPGRLAAWGRLPWIARSSALLGRRVVMGLAAPTMSAHGRLHGHLPCGKRVFEVRPVS